jgi:hypothetical protein
MMPRIKELKPLDDYLLQVIFDDGKEVLYDVKDDIGSIAQFADLENVYGLFWHVRVDESRTCVYWSDEIDLPSDTIYESGLERT